MGGFLILFSCSKAKLFKLPIFSAILVCSLSLIFSPQSAFAPTENVIADSQNLPFVNTHLPFITNQGQLDEQVKFYAKTFAGTVFVNEGGLTYSMIGEKLQDGTIQGIAFEEKFLTVQNLELVGLGNSDTVVNYFIGDQANWRQTGMLIAGSVRSKPLT